MHPLILINDKPVSDQSGLRLPSVSAVDRLNRRVARVAKKKKITQAYERESGIKRKKQRRKGGAGTEGQRKWQKLNKDMRR